MRTSLYSAALPPPSTSLAASADTNGRDLTFKSIVLFIFSIMLWHNFFFLGLDVCINASTVTAKLKIVKNKPDHNKRHTLRRL